MGWFRKSWREVGYDVDIALGKSIIEVGDSVVRASENTNLVFDVGR